MSKQSTRRVRPTVRGAVRRMGDFLGSGSFHIQRLNGDHGSGSFLFTPQCKFFSTGQLLPVALTLQFDALVEDGPEVGRQQLNRPAVLIHAQDPSFACCWFSRPIDLGDESGNPAFWMLQKTTRNTWSLCLRRVSGQMAAYHLKSMTKHFPITLKKGQTSKDFKWPRTITIIQDE